MAYGIDQLLLQEALRARPRRAARARERKADA